MAQIVHLDEGPFSGLNLPVASASQPVDIAILVADQDFALYKLDVGSLIDDDDKPHYRFLRSESLELIARSIYTLYAVRKDDNGQELLLPLELH